jgi:hypothetical protein
MNVEQLLKLKKQTLLSLIRQVADTVREQAPQSSEKTALLAMADKVTQKKEAA